MSRMQKFSAAFFLLVFHFSATGLSAQDSAEDGSRRWPTPGEKRGWFAPTTPVESGEYLTGLAVGLEEVSVDTLVRVEGGAAEPDSSLPVLAVSVRRPPSPGEERLRVLVLAGERGDALSGTEVSLQLVRELVFGDIGGLLDSIELVVVPSVNPWGLLWWMRDEPSGVDPSRDHGQLRSPATRAVHDLVARWRPHLIVELAEVGPSVYRVQAGLAKHPNVDLDLARFTRFYLLPHVANELSQASVTFRELVAVEPEGDAIGAPLLGAEGLPQDAWLTPGPLSVRHATNAFSLGGSATVMLAVASMGGVEGLPERVQLLYQAVGYLLQVAAGQAGILLDWEAEPPAALSVRQTWVRDSERPNLAWLVWNDRGQIVQQTTDRWRSVVRRQLALAVPAGWLVEPSGLEWVELLAAHGFTVERLEREATVAVGSYMIGVTAALPAELSEELPLDSAPSGSALVVQSEKEFPEGSWLIRSDQPRARLLFTLVEPWSQDAPLGRESPGAHDPDRLETYPVHRIDDAGELGALRTEVVRGAGDDGAGPE